MNEIPISRVPPAEARKRMVAGGIPADVADEIAGSVIASNPDVEVSVAANLIPWEQPPLRIDINVRGRTILSLRETGDGLLHAEYNPADLTEAARAFVQALDRMRLSTFQLLASPAPTPRPCQRPRLRHRIGHDDAIVLACVPAIASAVAVG